MEYMADFVLEVMKKISSSEPVLFQRDGSLYVASAEGFGQITYGLPIKPIHDIFRPVSYLDEKNQPPAILESIDAIEIFQDGEKTKKDFIDSEKKYFDTIAFGSDDNGFNLKLMEETAKNLRSLPDDGKIRMVSHRDNYHSHKSGYACDGIDVYVNEARVMDRKKYLELLNLEEEKLIESREALSKAEKKEKVRENYRSLRIPDCVIATPYIIVSLPRGGGLPTGHTWDELTRMESRYSGSTNGSILGQYDISNFESPFKLNIRTNPIFLGAENQKELETKCKTSLEILSKQFNAVSSSIGLAQNSLDRLNSAHNKFYEKYISSRRVV